MESRHVSSVSVSTVLAAFGLQPRPARARLARALCGRYTEMPAHPPLDVACLPCGPSDPIVIRVIVGAPALL